MSADAKIFEEAPGVWYGVHDGCAGGFPSIVHRAATRAALVAELVACCGGHEYNVADPRVDAQGQNYEALYHIRW